MNALDVLLTQGATAVKDGDRCAARRLLTEAVRQNPNSEAAWLWLGAALKTPQGRAFCLRQVLAHNPASDVAGQGLAALERAPRAPILVAQPLATPMRPRQPFALDQLTRRPWSRARSTLGTPVKTLGRIARYTVVRTAALAIAVAAAVYLTIVIANLGGYVDEIVKSRIDQTVAAMVQGGWLRGTPTEQKFEIVDQTIEEMRQAQGLYEPFVLRCLRWLGRGLTLDWGEAESIQVILLGRYSRQVKDVILDALPRTLLVFGIANFCLFGTSILLALALTRRHGSWLDRAVITLSPLSAAPAWVIGIVLGVLSYRVLGVVSLGGALDAWPDEFKLAYVPLILKHMILPFLAIFLSGLFQSVYAWRSFFLLYSSEDHVEVARAKGLPHRMVERRYILRPGLPAVLTSFALLLMGLWQEVVALELLFQVKGIGHLFVAALHGFDTAVILGLVVTFAYLLAITVFLLDIIYALVDPRVRVGSEGHRALAASRRRRRFRLRGRRRRIRASPWAPRPPPASRRVSTPLPERVRMGLQGLRRDLVGLWPALREMARYRPAVVGLALIAALIGFSVFTLIAMPYGEALRLWSGEDGIWDRTPQNAAPTWINALRKKDLPPTILLDSRDAAPNSHGSVTRTVTALSEDVTEIILSFSFDYPYGALPDDMVLYVDLQTGQKTAQVELTWQKPDGSSLDLGTYGTLSALTFYPDQDQRLQRRLGGKRPLQAMFAAPSSGEDVLQGRYELRLSGLFFDETAGLDAEFVLHGRIYGLMGTDRQGRDLIVPLLWGAPIALTFGLLAAMGTSLSTMIIAGAGVWFGGWVDSLIQRVTEVNMILPFLPISIMIYTLYSQSFWVIIGVTVLLSIFGSAIKSYRAIFLQLKEAPYIEAARSYGAGDWRIIFRYLVPRIGAVLIPQVVVMIPAFVFLETTLTFLGVGIAGPPTWGKLVLALLGRSSYSEDIGLVVLPLGLLLLTGFAFALLGMGLERFFEPRLRDR
jgi:peptide/nickel transport system permease protein